MTNSDPIPVLDNVELNSPLIDTLERLHKAPKREYEFHDDGTMTIRHADDCPCWVCNDRPHPRVQEIHDRQRERHDHTDALERCGACGRFLPTHEGHNRVVCDCGEPQTFWRDP